jgi:hypothetical protein
LVLKVPALWSALRGHFETDLTLAEVLALVPTALQVEPERVSSLYIGLDQADPWITPQGWWVLVPDPDKFEELVARFYGSLSEDGPLDDEGRRVQVQNGTQRAQLELIAADALYWEGFKVVETGAADHAGYEKTRLIVFTENPEHLARLKDLLHVEEENILRQPDPGQSLDFRIVLGNDYDPCR